MTQIKKVLFAFIAIVMFGLVISPVMAANSQTIIQSGSGNSASQTISDDNGVIQSAVAVQGPGTNNVQILWNFNSGTLGTQSITAYQSGNNNYQVLMNIMKGGSGTQTIVNTQTGNNNKFIKINKR